MADDGSPRQLQFPCQFTLKIIGHANEEFEGEVVKIINDHFPNLTEGAISLKPSKNSKFLAYSVTVEATSQAQLDAAYFDLSKSPHILFVL